MAADEDADMEEPIAHEKEGAEEDSLEKTHKSSSKKVSRDADSTDSTDALDNEGKTSNSHIQKSSKTIDETKSAVSKPKDKKDAKK
jgi:hypothetical protein